MITQTPLQLPRLQGLIKIANAQGGATSTFANFWDQAATQLETAVNNLNTAVTNIAEIVAQLEEVYDASHAIDGPSQIQLSAGYVNVSGVLFALPETIQTNAVTETDDLTGPFNAIGTSEGAVFSGSPDYLSVTGALATGKVLVTFSGSFTRTGGHSPTVTLRLYRGTDATGVLIATSFAGGSGVAFNQPFSIAAVDGGMAGNTNYFLSAQSDDAACTINNGVMYFINLKNG